MNLDKSTKRIAKKVKNGFQGYPKISLTYYGQSSELANKVVVEFISEEGAAPQSQTFLSNTDAKKDETIQTTLVKVIERANAKTVLEAKEITVEVAE
ncbi:hypothetical protein PCIT_b1276 [Pseudoalteromonas citrea]|uniref:Uncharacterized protein n=2 Tax=Pseudoalteromonas citrea TaxID=43655 RepID=A0AAD4AFQ1_9GAMM|nr:hypothetical protein [Pseudoalteromonas citrea]KAF7765126.1 hypothetical protein PCIT_b1276 [Pseudoalteromonas citrea]